MERKIQKIPEREKQEWEDLLVITLLGVLEKQEKMGWETNVRQNGSGHFPGGPVVKGASQVAPVVKNPPASAGD